MHFNIDEFRSWKNKNITLLGMSGVGKTYLAKLLRQHQWFHYSGDYRIGTRYLDEAILDLVKQQAMEIPLLRDLLRRDWIYIRNNIRIDDLGPVLSYIGKPGNPEAGGIPLEDFQQRQAKYREAEIAAMYDVPKFISKARKVYGYSHFINDAGGSLCELDAPEIIDVLAKHTLILYIQITDKQEEKNLIQRAQNAPKPLYYRPQFLLEQLHAYWRENNLKYAAEMNPDDFTRWVFPRLFHSRIPHYENIAYPHGYTVTSQETAEVRDEQDFLDLLEIAIQRKTSCR